MKKQSFVFGEPVVHMVENDYLPRFLEHLTDGRVSDFPPVVLQVVRGSEESTVIWCNRYEVE